MESSVLSFVSRYIDLSDEEAGVLLGLNLARSYPSGTLLLEQGAMSRQGYLVIQGIVRYHTTIGGTDRTTDFFSENEVCEPSCVADGSPSTHHVSCLEDCILFACPPEMQDEVMARFPRFEKVCRLVAEESLRTNWRMLQRFQLSTPQERYEHLLASRADLVQRVPQYMIASYLGIEPESLSRIRRRLATA